GEEESRRGGEEESRRRGEEKNGNVGKRNQDSKGTTKPGRQGPAAGMARRRTRPTEGGGATMAKASTFSVVRQEVWPALARGLEEASRSGARAASRDVLKRPVELLSLMAADAIGALGEDVLAAERMRMLLYLTAPFAARVEEARAVIERTKNGEAAYEPGALDHGALLLVALAAVPVAPPSAP